MIVCCGEALIDMIPRKLESGEDVYLPVAGGAVFNTAIGLGRLGEKVGFVCGVSTDLFGDVLIDALDQSSVSQDLLIRSAQPSTLAFVKLVDGHAQYSFMDENSAMREIMPDDLPDLPEATTALHFGAISLIGEPCGGTYEAMMARHASSKLISLDPNIRTGFISVETGYRARLERMCAMSDIIKVSDEDLDWLAGSDGGSTLIDKWLAAGTKVVIVTRGSEGADAHTPKGMITQASFKVDVVDTIGAGDTFNSGFLSGLSDAGLLSKDALVSCAPDDLAPALERAAKTAAVTVSRAGANPPWRNEIIQPT